MNKLFIIALLPLLQLGEGSIDCFHCNTDGDDYAWYDKDCGVLGYDGHRGYEPKSYSCFTEVRVFAEGAVDRGFNSTHHEDQECLWIEAEEDENPRYCRCFCDSDLCNNHNCQHCYEGSDPICLDGAFTKSTASTTEGTTTTPTTASTTTASTTTTATTATTTTASTTTSATTATTTSTTTPSIPSDGLTCYSCESCSAVDGTTNTAHGETGKPFLSCVTTGAFDAVLDELVTTRAGDLVEHVDGFCIHEDDIDTCYCTSKDLCNDGDH